MLDCSIVKLIPAQSWKYIVLSVLAAVCGAALVAGQHYEPNLRETIGPAATLLAAGESGLWTWFHSLVLVLCGQFALSIWWVRSHSVGDFSGSYRLWLWTAGFWLLAGLAAGTGIHQATTQTALCLSRSNLHGLGALCWMAPCTLAAAGLLWCHAREMRGCVPSVSLLLVSTLCYAIAGCLTLDLGLVKLLPHAALISHGVVLAGCICGCLSMSLHLRHVVHESAEPPVQKVVQPPRKQPAAKAAPVPAARTQTRAATAERKDAQPATSSAAVRVDAGHHASQTRADATSAKDDEAYDDDEYDDDEPQRHRKAPIVSPEELRGLSKRQRKELRKQRRDEERESREEHSDSYQRS